MAEENNGRTKFSEFMGRMLERTETIQNDVKDINAEMKDIRKILEDHTKCIERLKIKSSLWGFLAGSIPGLVTALILLLR